MLYTPTVAGPLNFHVTFNKEEVPNGNFTVKVLQIDLVRPTQIIFSVKLRLIARAALDHGASSLTKEQIFTKFRTLFFKQ